MAVETQPDETVFVVPPAWLRTRYARRGDPGLKPRRAAEAEKVSEILAEFKDVGRGRVRKVIEHPGTDPEIVAPALAYYLDETDAAPVGAAAVAMAWFIVLGHNQADRLPVLADVWLAQRGLRFAAEAVVEMFSMSIGDSGTYGSAIHPLRYVDVGDSWFELDKQALLDLAGRVRQELATASEEEFREVVAVLSGLRQTNVLRRVGTSFLAPTETAWVDADTAEVAAAGAQGPALVLLTSVSSREQADRIAPLIEPWWLLHHPALLTSFMLGMGVQALPWLVKWLSTEAAEYARTFLPAIGSIPTDAAFEALLDRADERYVLPELVAAASRFPARAMRLLAARPASRRTLTDLLTTHVLGHRDLAVLLLPELPESSAARIRGVLGRVADVDEAPADTVPPLLVSPPWAGRRTIRKPKVITGLECADPVTLDWAPGEAEAWSNVPFEQMRWAAIQDWERIVADRKHRRGGRWYMTGAFFAMAPLSLTLPRIRGWQPRDLWDVQPVMQRVVARHGLAAYPAALAAATEIPQAIAAVLPFTSPALATLMADRYARLKSVRAAALTWLTRHPVSAARALVPAAVGKAGPDRRHAEQALLALVAAGYPDEVRMAARSYGAEVAAEIEPLISTDPLDRLPAKMPVVPIWADPALLPPLWTPAGALPSDSVRHVLTMLALSRLAEPYPGLDVVRETVGRRDLAAFAWALFRRWQAVGMPPKEAWAFEALAHLGDDEVVRELAPLIRAWPGEGGHARAVTGLEVLSAIGTDVALMHLHGIAQKAKFKGLKDRATEKMAEVAAALELRPEQLADRLLPDFGLDGSGSLTLDYGPRRFVVGFDEQLKPFVAEADTSSAGGTAAGGKRLKALPKPGARDDAELAPEAYRRFSGLKKDVRTVAADQIQRLEAAMVGGRRWTGAEFRRYLVGHPLLVHIVRRVVWGVYDARGNLTGALRVAEDRTFADVDDEPVTVADDAVLGVAHPITLGERHGPWAEVFADYQISQPFPQLGREIFRLEPGEAEQRDLRRFKDVTVPTGRLLGLERRGWRRGEVGDGGHQGWFERDLPGDRTMVLLMDPGIAVGAVEYFPEQRLGDIYPQGPDDSAYWSQPKSDIKLGDLDEITISEIIRDLNEVTA